jgi:hypothetical protein
MTQSAKSLSFSDHTNYCMSFNLCFPQAFKLIYQSEMKKIPHCQIKKRDHGLQQASATYGTHAKCGMWNNFQWHAE